MSGDWAALVGRHRGRLAERSMRQKHRRAMWEELGLAWSACGPLLGDICMGMIALTPEETATFNAELDRRVAEELA